MATLATVLRKDKINKKGKAPIHFRITKNRRNRYISSSLSIEPIHWDEMKERIKPAHPNSSRLNSFLTNKYNELQDQVFEFETHSKSLSTGVLKEKIMGKKPADFFHFAEIAQQEYWEAKQVSTHKKNKYILQKLVAYRKGRSLDFYDIDVEFLKRYETYLRDVKGNGANTIHKDFRFIRTLFNRAVRLGTIDMNQNPFNRYKLKSVKTQRTYLTEEELQSIVDLSLDSFSQLDLTRDMFIFASYTGGLRISDILKLQKDNFDSSHIHFAIHKTKGQLSIKIPNKALDIINKWADQSQVFVFPFMPDNIDFDNVENLAKKISSKSAIVNKHLKTIASQTGLTKNLSFHVSRHTWVTRALRKGISLDKVSKLMGHAQLKDTQIYAKIVSQELDKAMDVFND